MPQITLPDGSIKSFDAPLTGSDLAASIGAGLAKAAIAIKVNGEQRDLTTTIDADAEVQILTLKDAEGLDVMRHTTAAQVLARAVKELYPSAKLAIGPTVEYGFYYDIDFEKAISSDELPKIEAKMQEILKSAATVERQLWPAEKVKAYFAERGEDYKVEIVEDAIAKNQLIDGDKLSVYLQNGDEFLDLCRGPHTINLGQVSPHFKLTNLAGAYWRGDSDNKMLTRIYGVSFASAKELNAHMVMLEEAAKRDHRKIGRELDLYHFQDEAPGQVFWHHNGWTVYLELMKYMREKVREHGYVEVNTPQMLDISFWQKSGHWDKYRENMFVVDESEETPFALKPMNCPGNIQVYKDGLRSYRELPIRMAEFGKVFRHEAHGARHGLMRVQSFTQDDAHIFCTPEQLEDEVVKMCELIYEVYNDLGFSEILVKFSTRPEERIGSEEDWDRAEAVLRKVCERMSLNWELNEGDGAFYAPKLDFVMRDAIGREWQCGTVQVDMNLPTRLDLTYIGEDGEKHRPQMVHRAIMGSIERFYGVLVEHFAGHFPLWLAPVQVVLTGITDDQQATVLQRVAELKAQGIRAEADLRSEKINYKVREHSHRKVPLIGVIGEKEVANGSVTIRRLGSGGQQTLSFDNFVTSVKDEVEQRQLPSQLKAAA